MIIIVIVLNKFIVELIISVIKIYLKICIQLHVFSIIILIAGFFFIKN